MMEICVNAETNTSTDMAGMSDRIGIRLCTQLSNGSYSVVDNFGKFLIDIKEGI